MYNRKHSLSMAGTMNATYQSLNAQNQMGGQYAKYSPSSELEGTIRIIKPAKRCIEQLREEIAEWHGNILK